jgi:uncharacterized membrane protein (DUF373 family)
MVIGVGNMVEEQEESTISRKFFRANWVRLTFYERFEYIVSIILVFLISLIIIIALLRLGRNIFELLVIHALDPLDFKVFQKIFGMILTLLIAMEFRHSIEGILEAKEHIVRVKTIILIALLALARKFIVLDYKNTSAEQIAALAFSAVALGVVYWLLKSHDRKKLPQGTI